MLMIFDSNVHVGSNGIKSCRDKQDWDGRVLLEIVKEEDLVLLNGLDICTGVVTRVDPRNGNESTLDLAICNEIMEEMIRKSGGARSVPQIFINDKHIGGCDDLYALDREGKLDQKLGLN